MKETRKSLIDCGISHIRLQNVDYVLNTDKESVCYGGSCLVYRAVKKDPHTHLRDQKVILKEFYPAHEDAGQWRKEHGWLELPREVEAGRTKFEKSYVRFIALCNQDMDVNTTKAHSTLAAPVGNSVFLEMEYS
ncbi:MAG: hypothetical protein IJB45_09055, partial [Clostridia bacterium]|nr:hypothetical protein [Clostridia bacterium]